MELATKLGIATTVVLVLLRTSMAISDCETPRIVRDLMETVGTLTEEVSNLKQKLAKPTVALNARFSADVKLENGRKVLYDYVMLNEGNAYDPQSGIFRAPVDGSYMFAVQSCSYMGEWDELVIVHDGHVVGRALSGDTVISDCGADVAIVYMKAGSEIWVERVHGSSSAVQRTHHGCSFSAALVN